MVYSNAVKPVAVPPGRAQGLHGGITQTPWLALPGLSKLDNLFGERVTGGVNDALSALEDHKAHFESDAHETDRLGIKSMAFQVGPDWHGSAFGNPERVAVQPIVGSRVVPQEGSNLPTGRVCRI